MTAVQLQLLPQVTSDITVQTLKSACVMNHRKCTLLASCGRKKCAVCWAGVLEQTSWCKIWVGSSQNMRGLGILPFQQVTNLMGSESMDIFCLRRQKPLYLMVKGYFYSILVNVGRQTRPYRQTYICISTLQRLSSIFNFSMSKQSWPYSLGAHF